MKKRSLFWGDLWRILLTFFLTIFICGFSYAAPTTQTTSKPTDDLEFLSLTQSTPENNGAKVEVQVAVADQASEIPIAVQWLKEQRTLPANATHSPVAILEGEPDGTAQTLQSQLGADTTVRTLSDQERQILATTESASPALKAKALNYFAKLSQNPSKYKLTFAIVRYVGVGSAVTYSFVTQGVPITTALLTSYGVVGAYTFAFQYWGDKYGQFLSDPTIITKVSKMATQSLLKVAGAGPSTIQRALTRMDQSWLFKRLDKMPVLNGLSSFFFLELVVLAPVLYLTGDFPSLFAGIKSGATLGLQASYSQGVYDFYVSAKRKDQMIRAVEDLEPDFQQQLANLGTEEQREELIKQRVDAIVMNANPTPAEKKVALRIAGLKLRHNFSLLSIAMVANAAVLLGISEDTTLRFWNQIIVGSMGAVGSILYTQNKYQIVEKVKATVRSIRDRLWTTPEPASQKCQQLLESQELPLKDVS